MPDTPFAEIRKVMDVCEDKDIQIYKVSLAVKYTPFLFLNKK